MTKSEIISLIKANPTAYMATTEGNQPHVRAMGIYDVDDNGVIIQTWTIKDIHRQIETAEKVPSVLKKGGLRGMF